MNIAPATNATVTNATTAAANGMRRNQQQLDDTAQNIAAGSLDPTDMVSLGTEANAFQANAAVMKTSNEMTQSLLNVLA